jgi:hypothetical protein
VGDIILVHSRAKVGTIPCKDRDHERVVQILMTGPKRYKVMSNELEPKTNSDQSVVYQIKIKGHLSREWIGWFEGLTITLEEGGDTLLTGPVIDQAALHGLLKKVRDLGMPLVSVSPIESGQTDTPGVKQAGTN